MDNQLHPNNNVPTMPSTGYLRVSQVLKFIPVSKTTWWTGVKTGRFPKAIKLGERITVWDVKDIRNYINSFQAKQ